MALKYDGTVVAWGDNSAGQLNVPAGLTGVTAIAAGAMHSVALKSDGTVVAWGRYIGPPYNWFDVPAGLNNVVAIAAGFDFTVALKSDGTVFVWGYNGYGQLDVPAGLTGVTAIAAGHQFVLALMNDGTVLGWGKNEFGQVAVPAGLTDVVAIAGGEFNSVALKSDGTVVAWGDSTSQVGITPPAGLSGVVAIGAGTRHILGLKSDGTVVGWGDAGSVPSGLTEVTAIAAGWSHNVVITIGNAEPAAAAGPDQTVTAAHTGNPANDTASVTLDASGSSDPDGDELTYEWTINGWAAGSSSQQPVILHPGSYAAVLKVTDFLGAIGEDSATITVNPALNQAPVANAGVDQTVAVLHDGSPATGAATFTLDGSASSDPELDAFSYQWMDAFNVPIGNTASVILSHAAGDYVYTLTVTDSYGASTSDSVTITVTPEANATPTLSLAEAVQATVGLPVSLSALAVDLDNDSLTYSLVGTTYGAVINPVTGWISWTPSTAGNYTLTVRVTDSYGASDTKSVSISVSPIIIEAVTVSRFVNKVSNTVTVQFNVRNAGSSTVKDITLNSATLKAIGSTSKLPVTIGTLKPGAIQKTVKLQFPGGSIPAGSAAFIVNGTSAAGIVGANAMVLAP